MLSDLRREEVVLIGFSRILLTALAGALPPASVLVVDEPEVVAKRDLVTAAAAHPVVSRLVPAEYQRPGAAVRLLDAEPILRAARAMVPGIEYAVEPAAEMAAALGLPGAGPGAAAIFRNKARQRRTAAGAGLRNPAYEVISDAAAALAFFDRIGARCIVKPTARQASLGVQFVHSRDAVATAFEHCRDADESLPVPSRGSASELAIEQRLAGAEYSVERLVLAGAPAGAAVVQPVPDPPPGAGWVRGGAPGGPRPLRGWAPPRSPPSPATKGPPSPRPGTGSDR